MVFSIFQILLLITERVHSFVLVWDVNKKFICGIGLVWIQCSFVYGTCFTFFLLLRIDISILFTVQFDAF